ncbi:hypothetical protein FDG2_5143 [Candidatus Protofrankia californiensis]|uniref:Uncharacterized protein n=1 Tax=Candidatus Protofrankia californiensis TaxID=1839754 RepID=A0A1C3PB70_9ACTN|nr:hypothetical protein FDG2_5143 [Candidatus Protofrankia californiensis]
MDGLQILPLAVTMMVGPQIMSAVIFVTTPKAVRVSSGFRQVWRLRQRPGWPS